MDSYSVLGNKLDHQFPKGSPRSYTLLRTVSAPVPRTSASRIPKRLEHQAYMLYSPEGSAVPRLLMHSFCDYSTHLDLTYSGT